MAGVCADLAASLDPLCVHPPTLADAAQLADLGTVYRRRAAKFRDDAQRRRERAGNSASEEGSSR